jgi:hypothetical protein
MNPPAQSSRHRARMRHFPERAASVLWRATCALCLLTGCESSAPSVPAPANLAPSGANPEVVPAPTDRVGVSQTATPGGPRRLLKESPGQTQPQAFNPLSAPTAEPEPDGEPRVPWSAALEAKFTWPGQVPASAFPGLEPEQALAAKLKASARSVLELQAPGRVRMELVGDATPLQAGSVLLGAHNRYGHLLVWPDRKRYRVLSPGSLLAVFREGRADAVPLLVGHLESERPLREQRFGFALTRTLITTGRGSLTLDRAEIPEAEAAGSVVCRFLLELLAAAPETAVCQTPTVPLRAHFEFPGATLDWNVESFKVRTEAVSPILLPPARASFSSRDLPAQSRALLNAAELAGLHRLGEPGSLNVANGDDVGAFVLLDGVQVAFLAPHSRLRISGLLQGGYRVQVRDFLGAELMPVAPLNIAKRTLLRWKLPDDAGAP